MKTALFILIGLLLATSVAPELSAQQVEIRLRAPAVRCFKKTLCIQDVAELTNGDPQIRRQLAGLDLHEFTTENKQINITNRLVHYRVVMAGVDEKLFTIVGATKTLAHYTRPISPTRLVEQTLMDQLSEQFQIPSDSFEIQLLTPIDPLIARFGIDADSLVVRPQFPPEIPLGNRTLEIGMTDRSGMIQSTNISVKISVFRDLVMAKENISRGEVLTEQKLEIVRRPIDNAQVRFASFDQVIGRQAQSDIQQFSLVKSQFVREGQNIAGAFVIKRNAVVSITIHRGPLVITLKDARAQENGRIGDYINFVNPKSNETIRAKIVDATTATIEM